MIIELSYTQLGTAGVSLFSKPCACLSFVWGVGCFWVVVVVLDLIICLLFMEMVCIIFV